MATMKLRWILSTLFAILIQTSFASDAILNKDQYRLLRSELNKYEQIARQGGWNKIVLDKKYYIRGESGNTIVQVKRRLAITDDFTSEDESPMFTEALAESVLQVRKRFGLPSTSSIDAALVKALNVPVEKRLAQLEANAARIERMNLSSSGTHLVANIPEYKLHVYENGKEVFNMDIVVGKPSSKTVAFDATMTQVVFSPYWYVPSSIVRNEILPAARRNRNYLRNNRYEVVGRSGGLPAIRQKPGASNSLGKVKFLFPNSYNIYFHDTPAKSLFKMDKRAYSHGCVRLAEPAKLAEYLLRNDPSWTPEKIHKAMESGREQAVKLSAGVPVSIVYFTAWVDEDGALNFRDDVYGKDK